MGVGVLTFFRLRMVRTAAILTIAGAAAGCSNDVTRLQDGFYTGAIPQNTGQQTAQAGGYGQSMAQSSSGYPAGGGYAAQQGTYSASAATPQVSRSQLPPPGGQVYESAATAQQLPPPAQQANVYAAGSPAPIAQQAAAPQQRPAGEAVTETVSASPQPARTPAHNGPTVTVAAGDSLNAIAQRAGVSVADLRAANGLASDNIRIGQTLNLPSGSSNTRVASLGAQPTTLQAQAATVSGQAAPQQAAAPAAAPAAAEVPAAAPASTVAEQAGKEVAALAPASTGIDQFRWPVQGRVVKGFGDKIGTRRNDGVNISVPRGTPVKAAENGVVIYAGEGLKEFGKTVLVKHDNGLVTVYGHADEILVERGATVRRGQDIAKAGMTGDTDTPILHFEVRKDSSPVNPMTYLQ